MVATADIGDNPLKRNINIAHAAKLIFIVEMELPPIRAKENQLLFFLRQLLKWLVHINAKGNHRLLQHLWIVVGGDGIPRR